MRVRGRAGGARDTGVTSKMRVMPSCARVLCGSRGTSAWRFTVSAEWRAILRCFLWRDLLHLACLEGCELSGKGQSLFLGKGQQVQQVFSREYRRETEVWDQSGAIRCWFSSLGFFRISADLLHCLRLVGCFLGTSAASTCHLVRNLQSSLC